MKRFVNTSSKEEEKEKPSKRDKKGNTRKSQKDSIQ
jgi:hypothetical protein